MKGFRQEMPTVPPPASLAFKCIVCMKPADILHKGTSYCRPDYQEKLRLGEI